MIKKFKDFLNENNAVENINNIKQLYWKIQKYYQDDPYIKEVDCYYEDGSTVIKIITDLIRQDVIALNEEIIEKFKFLASKDIFVEDGKYVLKYSGIFYE